ncbi:hypothetical protein GLYMA_01G161051v4 [Glycine max]|nr:hypothetical protein GLYMA_01G161051v4 [Glycine max]KAH1163379.1 hypothetical protein GYH30_001757 [Glycine max]
MLILQSVTGWFSQHMINCIRQRLIVQYLSVFPKPGAENLLRAATLKFEKLKRECYRHAMKLDGEECQQANLGLEENEELDNVEDEEDAAEGNDSDEEWEEEHELLEIMKCPCRLIPTSTLRIFQGLICRIFLLTSLLMKLIVTMCKQMSAKKNIKYTGKIVRAITLTNDF